MAELPSWATRSVYALAVGLTVAFFELLRQEGKDPWKYREVPGWKLAPLLRSRLKKGIREIGQELVETYLTHRDRAPAEPSG